MCRSRRHTRLLLFLTAVTFLLTLFTGCAGEKQGKEAMSPGTADMADESQAPETVDAGTENSDIPGDTETASSEGAKTDLPGETETDLPSEENIPSPGERSDSMVRVAITLEMPSLVEKGFSIQDGINSPEGIAYLEELKVEQATVIARIEEVLGHPLDVAQTFTLSVNVISANVYSGDVEQIRTVEGVVGVAQEESYHPLGG